MGLTFGKIQSLNLQRSLNNNSRLMAASLERLSTGYRINRAADDAAGLSISEQLIGQIRSLEQSVRNSQDGYSMLTVADGATQTITENVQRIRELTVQAANDTLATAERDAIEAEINARTQDINRIAESTTFNNIPLLNASVPAQVNLQIGPNNTANDVLDVRPALGNARATALGLSASVNFANATEARNYLTKVDAALTNVNSRRSSIGAYQNRLDSVVSNLSTTAINLSAANSRIRDTDVAAETSKLVRYQLLQQFDVSLMSQLNSIMASTTMGMLGG